jgi:DNA polymerase-3 subunit epsilon
LVPLIAHHLAAVVGVVCLAAYAIYSELDAADQQRVLEMFSSRVAFIVSVSVVALAAIGALFAAVHRARANNAIRIADELRFIFGANRSHRVDARNAGELEPLARLINHFAERYETLERDLEARVAEARASVEEERNRLASLMSELSQGVLVCNLDGQILLYNERARAAFADADARGDGNGAPTRIGLGRSIFAIIERSLLAHALERIRTRMRDSPHDLTVQFVTTTGSGQLIRVHITPVLAKHGPASADDDSQVASIKSDQAAVMTGFVMTVDNITRSFERESARDLLVQALTDDTRAGLANIRAAAETLANFPDCDRRTHDRFIEIISEEARRMSGGLDDVMAFHADSLKTRWPLEEMLGTDAIAAARRRIESELGLSTHEETLDSSVWVNADSYTLVQMLTYLASRLHDEYDVSELHFALSREGRLARIDLGWTSAVVSRQTLPAWQEERMRTGSEGSPLSVRDVLDRHGADIVFIADKPHQRSCFRLLLPLAEPAKPSPPAPIRRGDSRPEFYDFNLLYRAGHTGELAERALTDLTYTVLDTETTGLNPSHGDEIISIAAVRIVNNRLLRNEVFDQLVKSERPTTATSLNIHGVTREMLANQPPIEQVLPRFHDFCADTVLVAHNAAFDMRFLQMQEANTGILFRQPVLDTLLLSAVLDPDLEDHSLEAIAQRLGVPIIGRHTALGDALLAADIFLRMIPLLASRGIRTLRQARAATDRTLYAKVAY